MADVGTFTIYENVDTAQAIQWKDIGTGAVIDFTGSTFAMDIKAAAGEGAATLSLTTANSGVASTDLSNGKITINIADGALSVGSYVFDLVRIVTATGARELMLTGTLTVVQGVTQP